MRSALAAFLAGAVAAFALVTFVLPLVIGGGHAQSGTAQASSSAPPTGPAASGTQPADRDFALAAAIACKFEVIEGRLALAQATDPRLRDFAQVMVDDHTAALEELKAAARSGGVDLPADIAPDAIHYARINAIKNRRGPDFDQAYRTDQVQGHEQTAALLAAYAQSGDNGALKAWAARALAVARRHQQMLRALGTEPGPR